MTNPITVIQAAEPLLLSAKRRYSRRSGDDNIHAYNTLGHLASSVSVSKLDQIKASPVYVPDSENAKYRQRRRSQNRAAQRAFRDRKTRHVEGLEITLSELIETNRSLHDAYQQKVVETDILHAHVKKLNGKVDMLQISKQHNLAIFTDRGGARSQCYPLETENAETAESTFGDIGEAPTFDLYSIFADPIYPPNLIGSGF